MFAIIKSGGKQYKVAPGETVKVEKLDPQAGDTYTFEEVLMVADGENVKLGTPLVKGAKVEGRVVQQGRDDKKIVFKYHSKTRYKKKKGHRQPFTEIEILKINS
jgi:large subunit ribosomal protein L21